MSKLKSSNRTIVAIAVHPKLNVGDVWYNAEPGDGQQMTLVTRPYFRRWLGDSSSGTWWIRTEYSPGDIREYSLGDDGVPGFAYDTRPFHWVKTTQEVEKRETEIEAWRLAHLPEPDPFYSYDF